MEGFVILSPSTSAESTNEKGLVVLLLVVARAGSPASFFTRLPGGGARLVATQIATNEQIEIVITLTKISFELVFIDDTCWIVLFKGYSTLHNNRDPIPSGHNNHYTPFYDCVPYRRCNGGLLP